MRIAFLGKGGSGKTTLCSAFVRWVSRNQEIVAIDADLNTNLQQCLGIQGDIKPISEKTEEIKTYLRGRREDITNEEFVSTTPPNNQSRLIKPHSNDLFMQMFAHKKDNILFLKVGSYTEDDIGQNCYHGKLGCVEHIFHHMLDKEQEYIVSDATAGVDNLGTSLFYSYDINLFVVEPTEKSVQVYLDFKKFTEKNGIKLFAVINKVEDEDDITFIKKFISEKDILSYFPKSINIKKFEQGDLKGFEQFISQTESSLQDIKSAIDSTKKDWDTYTNNLIKAHKDAAFSWWNDYYKKDLTVQIDPQLSYKKLFEEFENEN